MKTLQLMLGFRLPSLRADLSTTPRSAGLCRFVLLRYCSVFGGLEVLDICIFWGGIESMQSTQLLLDEFFVEVFESVT